MSAPAIFAAVGAAAYYAYRRIFSPQPTETPPPPMTPPHIPVHRRPSPASNSDTSYFPRSPKDISTAISILESKLPTELVLQIIDFAEYFVRETAERRERLVIAEPTAGTAYLRSWPILWASGGASSNSPPYPGTSLSFDDLPEEAPSSSPPIPAKPSSKPGPVSKIVFTLSSRDQGWSSQPRQYHGTYEESCTWFEARVINPLHPSSPPPPVYEETANRHGAPRRHLTWTSDLTDALKAQYRPREIQRNVHASRQFVPHVITWTAEAEDEEERNWVRALQQGECVEVTVWARYPGWSNHVESVKIDVFVDG